jgi:hypothetical protein
MCQNKILKKEEDKKENIQYYQAITIGTMKQNWQEDDLNKLFSHPAVSPSPSRALSVDTEESGDKGE